MDDGDRIINETSNKYNLFYGSVRLISMEVIILMTHLIQLLINVFLVIFQYCV